jgi:hypothetical protein
VTAVRGPALRHEYDAGVDRLLDWRTLVVIFVADDVLYVLAGATAKSSHHPGTLSDVVGDLWLAGAVILIVLVIIAVVRSSRAKRAGG